jgi:hypothetical protein
MRWVYYSVALVATIAACFLWWVVLVEVRGGASPEQRSVLSSGVLPVPPKLRPADPVHAALFEQMQRGQAVCLDGFYAVKGGDDTPYVAHSNDERVPCP